MNESVFASQIWTNGTRNRLWNDPLNWSGSANPNLHVVPIYPASDANIIDAGISGTSPAPILNGQVPYVRSLYVGVYGPNNGTTGILNVTSGDIFNLMYLLVGSASNGNNPGMVNLSGGSLTPDTAAVIGKGSFNMTGGTFTTAALNIIDTTSATAYMHLDGGTANASSLTIGGSSYMDITKGTMILDGNAVSIVNGYVSGGRITAYNGVGRVLVDYGKINAGRTTITAARSKLIAWGPTPIVGCAVRWQDVNSTVLKWSSGDTAASHDVYIGNSFSDVNDASTSDLTGIYRGHQSGKTYNPLPLAQDTVYYWRIDEVDAGGVVSKGDVWSFTVCMAQRDLYSDTWVATDAIGRTLSGYNQCGPQRNGKVVGIFYFLWHQKTSGASDVTKIIAAHPFTYPTNPWYDNPDFGPQYTQWWAEPEAGYFVATDKWVVRRNVSMLANAGVDVLFIDATNAIVYWPELYALCDVMRDMQVQGNKTPQICFLTHSYSPQTVTSLYNSFYAAIAYPELWFYWQGKPLMLGYPDGISSDIPAPISVSTEIRNFFTWRESWAWDAGYHKWQWLDTYPQDFGWDTSSSKAEEVPVGVASHPTINIGRSFQNGVQPSYNQYHLPTTGTQGQGLCFAEQWRRGLELDPNVIFITGWNEWVASWWKDNGSPTFLGLSVPSGGYYFVDAYNQEYSRDIEPMKGGYTDNYYYQMIDGIRRYKGVRSPLTTSSAKTITIGYFSDWDTVRPEYRDAIGDTAHRNSIGQGSLVYINNTGRNDFVNMKVARDNNFIYFYAQTQEPISSYTDPNWMLLFIDTDQNKATGWEGYDYLINYGVINSTTTSLKHTAGGWNWTPVNNNISYRASGNKIELAIPRSDISEIGSDVKFDFHWADNIQKTNDIDEFAVSGDSAPDRRFNYRYDTSLADRACAQLQGGSQDKAMDLDGDCDIDIDDVSLLAAEWLNLYTFTNFTELANDWLLDYMPDSYTGYDPLLDDFETGNFSKYAYVHSGNAPWTITSVSPYQGSFCAKSGSIGNRQTSSLEITIYSTATSISFYRKVSSEQNYDFLKFYVDGALKSSWSGEQAWAKQTHTITSGKHTFKWEYSKDYSISTGSDCAWIDLIQQP